VPMPLPAPVINQTLLIEAFRMPIEDRAIAVVPNVRVGRSCD